MELGPGSGRERGSMSPVLAEGGTNWLRVKIGDPPSLMKNAVFVLDCYWVGSLDFNFLGKKCVFH